MAPRTLRPRFLNSRSEKVTNSLKVRFLKTMGKSKIKKGKVTNPIRQRKIALRRLVMKVLSLAAPIRYRPREVPVRMWKKSCSAMNTRAGTRMSVRRMKAVARGISSQISGGTGIWCSVDSFRTRAVTSSTVCFISGPTMVLAWSRISSSSRKGMAKWITAYTRAASKSRDQTRAASPGGTA